MEIKTITGMTRTLKIIGTLEKVSYPQLILKSKPVKYMKQLELSYTAGRHQIDTITLENCLAIYIKANIYLHYGPAISMLGITQQKLFV